MTDVTNTPVISALPAANDIEEMVSKRKDCLSAAEMSILVSKIPLFGTVRSEQPGADVLLARVRARLDNAIKTQGIAAFVDDINPRKPLVSADALIDHVLQNVLYGEREKYNLSSEWSALDFEQNQAFLQMTVDMLKVRMDEDPATWSSAMVRLSAISMVGLLSDIFVQQSQDDQTWLRHKQIERRVQEILLVIHKRLSPFTLLKADEV